MALCMAMLITTVGTVTGCSNTDAKVEEISPNDIAVEVLCENGNESANQKMTYTFGELSCTVIDEDGNVEYSGPMLIQDNKTRAYTLAAETIKPGVTVKWYPTNNSSGFKTGKGIAVKATVKTNAEVSKVFGLTNGSESTGMTKNVSAILYTGTAEYWKFYVKNASSSSFKLTGGNLTWGE